MLARVACEAFRSRPASRRQRSDLVTLAHIKEQSRLSLGSSGRPRMTEELKEIGLDVGHRRVGRLMRQNGISVVRTRKHRHSSNIRLDSRAVAHLYTLASKVDWQDMNTDEQAFAKAALSRENPPYLDVYVQSTTRLA